MEIVLFICMMIVPFISIAALVLAAADHKRVEALKKLYLNQIAHSEMPVAEKLEAMEL